MGGSDVDISPFGVALYTDTYETERFLFSASVTTSTPSSFLGSSHWFYSPNVGYTYYDEDLGSYEDNFGNQISKRHFGIDRFEFGNEFSRTMLLSTQGELTSTLGLSGIYDKSSTGILSTPIDDLKARLDFALLYDGSSGIRWNANTYLEGIGSDNRTFGLSLGLSISY